MIRKMIYIVEDDESIRELESYALINSGFAVTGFEEGTAFFEACAKLLPKLIILDVMLPGEDGLKILKRIKSDETMKSIPVIMVTAKSTELDTVKGLDLGSDDYITKPFGVMELLSRVKAVLRRYDKREVQSVLSFGGVVLDDERRTVTENGRPCELTFKEYELLKCLMTNNNIVLSREKITETVWGYDFVGETRTVDMHIKTLRQKLSDCGGIIKTVRNVGYKVGD